MNSEETHCLFCFLSPPICLHGWGFQAPSSVLKKPLTVGSCHVCILAKALLHYTRHSFHTKQVHVLAFVQMPEHPRFGSMLCSERGILGNKIIPICKARCMPLLIWQVTIFFFTAFSVNCLSAHIQKYVLEENKAGQLHFDNVSTFHMNNKCQAIPHIL